jgi:hypothetical protein
VSDECIHGFQAGLCATCFPKSVPEAPAIVRAVTRPRAVGAPRRASTVRTGTRGVTGSAPLDDVRQQRVYHLTHISNLPSILADGAVTGGATPTVPLSSPEVAADRRTTPIPGEPDATLADFVPFFLSPNALLWQSIRSHVAHPRASRDILATDPADFVLLVANVRELIDSGASFIVTDGVADAPATRFGATTEEADRTLRRLRSEPLQESILEAELLVRDRLPFEFISLIGVAHDKARAAVREILLGADFSPKVSVYPPWFASE